MIAPGQVWLAETGKHSLYGWARAIGASPWDCGMAIENFNHAADLDRWLTGASQKAV